MASLATNGTERELTKGPEPDLGPELVEALQAVTRVLVGIALKSLDRPDDAVSLPQFRVLAILADLGPTRPGRIARALGIEPSTVTRLADRLVASEHVVRSSDPDHRGAITLTLTQAGSEVVAHVAQWRRTELSRIAAQLPPADQAATTQALRRRRRCRRTRLRHRHRRPDATVRRPGRPGSAGAAGHSPVAPSMRSRSRSAWPRWRAYSLIR